MRVEPFFVLVKKNDADAVRAALDSNPSLLEALDGDHLPIHEAALRGNAAVLDALIECGADINRENGWGWTPIVLAAYHNRLEAVRRLIEAGAKVGEDGGNPIHYACQNRHREICRLLVEHGAVDSLVPDGDPDALSVFRSAYAYDASTLRHLLKRRPELANARDRYDRTPMHEAATGGALEVVKTLIEAGGDLNAEDEGDETPLTRAAAHRQEAVVETLIAAGARVDLFTAAQFNILEEARRLLQENPDLARAEHNGHALTEWAAEAGFVEMGRLLAEFGAEIDIHAAASFGMTERAAQLLDGDPDLVHAQRAMGGYAPLHAAAECGQTETAALLIQRGADLNQKNGWGFRPLHLSVLAARGHAPTEAHLHITRALIENGADLEPEDDYGRTPLSLAEGHWTKGEIEHALIDLLRTAIDA